MIMVCSYLTTREYFMAGERPVFTKDNPLWEYISLFHSYTARLSYSLSLGDSAIDTAVYFPVRDIWAGGPGLNEISESNDTLAKLLLEKQCDFDFIDDDILERESTEIIDGKLKVGPMQYRTVYISKTKWMSDKSKKRLREFILEGGQVLWVDDKEYPGKPEGSIQLEFGEIGKYLKPLVGVEPENKKIRVCKRKLKNGNMYFIISEDLNEFVSTIKFNEYLPAVYLDPETGDCRRVNGSFFTNGVWSIPLKFSISGSYLIYFTEEEIPSAAATYDEENAFMHSINSIY